MYVRTCSHGRISKRFSKLIMVLEEKYSIIDLPTKIASYSSNINQQIFEIYKINNSKYKRHLAELNPRYDWAFMEPTLNLKYLPYQELQGIDVW